MSEQDERKKNMPFIVKYLPEKMDEIVSQDSVINNIKLFIENGSLPNMLFYGLPGTGKTSTISMLTEYFYGKYKKYMVMELNSSSERGIDVIRNEVKSFTMVSSFLSTDSLRYKKKMIILDEIDSMTIEAQNMLRKIIEGTEKYVTFCLLCNEIQQVIQGLQSRCMQYKFSPIKETKMKERMETICKKENIIVEDGVLETIAKNSNGDFRNGLNKLQLSANGNNNKISLSSVKKYSTDFVNEFIENTVMKKSLKEIIDESSFIINNKGIDLSKLIELTSRYYLSIVSSKKIKIDSLKEILTKLAKLDLQLKEDTNDMLYLMTYCSILYLELRNK